MEKLTGKSRIYAITAILAAAVILLMAMNGMGSSGGTDISEKMEDILMSVEGTGKVKVMINTGENGEVTGVVVAAEGAEDIALRLKLISAVKTLLGIDGSMVEVLPM